MGSMDSQNLLIILNGASSSGKTTIARALLSNLAEPQIYTGLDDVLERVQPFGPEGGNMFNRFSRPWRVLWFQITDGRLRLFKQLHRDVVAHYRMGKNIVVDTALMDGRALLDAAECFAPLGGFFIGIKPPIEVSEQWEAARGDRNVGHARAHYDLIHAHEVYDLVLDPSQITTQECAQVILSRLQGPAPDAFQRILDNR